MKRILVIAALFFFVGGVFAQSSSKTPAEQAASQTTVLLTQKLDLTQDEQNKVYEIYVDHYQKMEELGTELKASATNRRISSYQKAGRRFEYFPESCDR